MAGGVASGDFSGATEGAETGKMQQKITGLILDKEDLAKGPSILQIMQNI